MEKREKNTWDLWSSDFKVNLKVESSISSKKTPELILVCYWVIFVDFIWQLCQDKLWKIVFYLLKSKICSLILFKANSWDWVKETFFCPKQRKKWDSIFFFFFCDFCFWELVWMLNVCETFQRKSFHCI